MALPKEEFATKFSDELIEEFKDGDFLYYKTHTDAYNNKTKVYPIDDPVEAMEFKMQLDNFVIAKLIQFEELLKSLNKI